jgi:hypothetical protein
MILLPLPPEFWDYRYIPLRLAWKGITYSKVLYNILVSSSWANDPSSSGSIPQRLTEVSPVAA